jgi:predicted Zn-dependent protease
MVNGGRLSAAVAIGALAAGCAFEGPVAAQLCANPDVRLAALVESLETRRAQGCEGSDGVDCVRIRFEIERQMVICPGHVPTLMANAVIAYDERRPEVTQQLLDQILSPARSHPDAAALRAQIAIDDGNLAFARRLLEQQIRLTPDHARLHETYGAALYLGGALPEAERELTAAGAFGAPRWRIAYHLGLIAEARARPDEAERFYAEALQANPAWAPAQSRLNALRVAPAP